MAVYPRPRVPPGKERDNGPYLCADRPSCMSWTVKGCSLVMFIPTPHCLGAVMFSTSSSSALKGEKNKTRLDQFAGENSSAFGF